MIRSRPEERFNSTFRQGRKKHVLLLVAMSLGMLTKMLAHPAVAGMMQDAGPFRHQQSSVDDATGGAQRGSDKQVWSLIGESLCGKLAHADHAPWRAIENGSGGVTGQDLQRYHRWQKRQQRVSDA